MSRMCSMLKAHCIICLQTTRWAWITIRDSTTAVYGSRSGAAQNVRSRTKRRLSLCGLARLQTSNLPRFQRKTESYISAMTSSHFVSGLTTESHVTPKSSPCFHHLRRQRAVRGRLGQALVSCALLMDWRHCRQSWLPLQNLLQTWSWKITWQLLYTGCQLTTSSLLVPLALKGCVPKNLHSITKYFFARRNQPQDVESDAICAEAWLSSGYYDPSITTSCRQALLQCTENLIAGGRENLLRRITTEYNRLNPDHRLITDIKTFKNRLKYLVFFIQAFGSL